MTRVAALTVITMEENGHAQENDGVGVDDVPPERHLCGVCEFALQLRLLLWTELRRFLVLQSAEAHHGLLAEAGFLLGFCATKKIP